MHVVVVESPSKAKTINKYLGRDYQVLASFGHVRDLPSKDGSVEPGKGFAMHYQTDPDSKKHIAAIAKALKGATTLYLATDPDREGEAISWHVVEALQESKALPKSVNVKRIVFHEITKNAVLDAVAHPRDIDMDLVNAQQARRALDYLVGFTLSPVLWRKLPGSRSAGRVQSVALRLICERDGEIEKFVSEEYWDITTALSNAKGDNFKARLTYWQGEKLEKFSIPNEARAKEITEALRAKSFTVRSVEPKQARRHPQAPFTTSTLQQEASRKLGFSAKRTMQLAQKLYEGAEIGGETVGLITYMRTDGVTVSQEAIGKTRDLIKKQFGERYLPSAPKVYKVKTSNAQEAHEAIRPTDIARSPDSVKSALDNDLWRLYDLIWKRMAASQMESAVYDQVIVDLDSSDKQATLHTTGSVLKFDGFLTLYQEGKDDEEEEEQKRLPELSPGEAVTVNDVLPEQHFTEPPPRFTEASLVKKLEELGIGRPSTYASIISVLQDRGYVKLEKKRFIAEMLGRLVNGFLVSFFKRYVEYDFTAQLEDRLDDVSAGEYDWKALLTDFWKPFIEKIDESKKLANPEVLETLDKLLESLIFPNVAGHADPRACPNCADGRLGLKTGKFGAFVGCSHYPECNYTRQLVVGETIGENPAAESAEAYPKVLGADPATGEKVSLRKGPYGMYVQLGEGKTPRRASLFKTMNPETVTLETALSLLSLPREIGMHPETGKPIIAGTGRYGPYVQHDGKYTSLRGDDDPLTIGINRAVAVIADSAKGAKAKIEPIRALGAHPEDGEKIQLFEGRYGPYVKHGKTNASLTKDQTVDSITLEQALELIAKRGGGKTKRKAVKKSAAKSDAKPAKSSAAKKAPAKSKKAASG